MPPQPMAIAFAKILGDDPQLAFDFYCAASEIVDDFEDWGPALQGNEDGSYDENTPIGRLTALRKEIIARHRALASS